MLFGELADLVFGEIELETGPAKAKEAALPDFQRCISVEFGVIEADMDAGSECFVKFTDSVCC